MNDTTTLLVFAPSCTERRIRDHITASLSAGNAVEVALFEPAAPLVALLLAVLTALLPDRFAVLSEGSGWKAGAVESSIIVVTEADAFVNNAPWVRFRTAPAGTPGRGLIEFYSTVPAADCDPR